MINRILTFALLFILASSCTVYTNFAPVERRGYVDRELDKNTFCSAMLLDKTNSANFPEDALRRGSAIIRSRYDDCEPSELVDLISEEACKAEANIAVIEMKSEMKVCVAEVSFYYLNPKADDYYTMLLLQQQKAEVAELLDGQDNGFFNNFIGGCLGASVGFFLMILFIGAVTGW